MHFGRAMTFRPAADGPKQRSVDRGLREEDEGRKRRSKGGRRKLFSSFGHKDRISQINTSAHSGNKTENGERAEPEKRNGNDNNKSRWSLSGLNCCVKIFWDKICNFVTKTQEPVAIFLGSSCPSLGPSRAIGDLSLP